MVSLAGGHPREAGSRVRYLRHRKEILRALKLREMEIRAGIDPSPLPSMLPPRRVIIPSPSRCIAAVPRSLKIATGIMAVTVVLIWLILLIPGRGAPPPLPPHVLVAPNASFIVEDGYTGLGAFLCKEGRFEVRRLGDRLLLVCDNEQAHSFSYKPSQRYEP